MPGEVLFGKILKVRCSELLSGTGIDERSFRLVCSTAIKGPWICAVCIVPDRALLSLLLWHTLTEREALNDADPRPSVRR